MFRNMFKKFSKDVGIDLGTSNTLIYVKDRGIVVKESSIVAINNRNGQILAVAIGVIDVLLRPRACRRVIFPPKMRRHKTLILKRLTRYLNIIICRDS